MDQWNRTESPKMNPYLHSQLVYNKGGKNIQWGKDSLFNKWFRENWTATCKRIKLDYFLKPCTKINSKCFKDLTDRWETIKILEENTCRTHLDINYNNIFLDLSPKARETKAKINKWDLIRLKRFCTAMETLTK